MERPGVLSILIGSWLIQISSNGIEQTENLSNHNRHKVSATRFIYINI